MSLDWLRREAAEPVLQLASGELPVTIRRHTRATRLTMRLAPDGSEVRITLPRWGSTRDAMAFAQERAGWVEAQLARIPQALQITPGSRVPYRGRDLAIDWQEKAPRHPRLVDDRITLGGPQDNLAPRSEERRVGKECRCRW